MATVLKQPAEELTRQGLSNPRVAVASSLSVLTAEDHTEIERAWIESHWHVSSLGLLMQLEAAIGSGSEVAIRPVQRVTVLLHPDLRERMDGDVLARLGVLASLLGCSLDIVDRGRLDSRSVRRRLEGTAAGSMVVVGPSDTSTEQLEQTYQDIGRDRIVRRLDGGGQRGVVEQIAEVLLELTGVSGALMPVVPRGTSPKRRYGRAPMPIADPIECQHLGDRVYVHDGETGLWWTRDDDQHAGSIFKTYTRVDMVLVHEADRDATGEKIDKHKGPSGARIDLGSCHRCTKKAYKHLK